MRLKKVTMPAISSVRYRIAVKTPPLSPFSYQPKPPPSKLNENSRPSGSMNSNVSSNSAGNVNANGPGLSQERLATAAAVDASVIARQSAARQQHGNRPRSAHPRHS